MDSELNENRKQNIKVEDVAKWPFSRKLLDRLWQTVSLECTSVREIL